VQTYQINISKGRDRVHEIRNELFDFPEILDVFVTSRPDSLVVVFWGRPRPGEWLRALRALGYAVPARRHASAAAPEVDRADVAALCGDLPVWPPIAEASRRAGAGHRQIIKKPPPAHPTAAYRR
jgi:hypothetical protein